MSILLPTFTKDVAIIWWANALATILCYIYAYFFKKEIIPVDIDEDTEEIFGKTMEQPNFFPNFVLQAFKALDYGSGQERGTRK